jgi:hypothetical protein
MAAPYLPPRHACMQPERPIYEPPPPLAWIDRHPHLGAFALWGGGVAFLVALSWVFA